MHRRFLEHCIRAAVLSLSIVSVLTGCQKKEGILQEDPVWENPAQENTAFGAPDLKNERDYPLKDLFTYLNKEGAGIPYAYAQILIAVSDSEEKKREEDSEGADYEFRQDIVEMEGMANISWQSFQTAEEFREYFSFREKEKSILPEKEEYVIEFAYYQYKLEEDTHAIDVDRFLKERYDKEDNPLYAITISESRELSSYCFKQSDEREMVVVDNILYGLECKGIAKEIEGEEVNKLLMAYSTQKQGVKEYNGWGLNDEELYWIDHDERVISLENPTRVFKEIKGTDTTWDGRIYMENFALLKEADYQIKVYEDGPMLQLHFEFTEELPSSGYEAYLSNGFCTEEDYEMTITNTDTGELLQNQKVRMSIELPDMITFADLNEDGYLDMQIDKPTHWSGTRAEVDEYAKHDFMLWNPETEIFEAKSEKEVAESLRQNQREYDWQEEKNFIVYEVQSGDTLWGISRRFYGTGIRYTEIEERNMEVLSGYRYLMPGMVLKIQAPIRLP